MIWCIEQNHLVMCVCVCVCVCVHQGTLNMYYLGSPGSSPRKKEIHQAQSPMTVASSDSPKAMSPNQSTEDGLFIKPMMFIVCPQSYLTLCTPWSIAHQAPLSMEFSKQESWSGLPFPSPEDLPNPGIAPTSLASPTLADRFFTTVSPGKPMMFAKCLLKKIILEKIRSQETRQIWKDIYGKETIIPKSMIV